MKFKGKWILLFLLFVIIILIGIRLFSKGEDSKSADNIRNRNNSVIAVKALIVAPRIIGQTIKTTGTILSNEGVELKCESSGRITKIYFNEGSFVKKGDLLLKINDADLQAQLSKAKSKKNYVESIEKRQKELFEKKIISQEEYETALNELNSVSADIENIKAMIDKTELRAPFDGIVGLRYVSEGAYINVNSRIASLQNNNPAKIDFSVPQKYAGFIKKNMKIEFKVANSGVNYVGDIYAIEPGIDPITKTLQIRALCQNNNYELIPGAFVEVIIDLKTNKKSIGIPAEAVFQDITGENVYLFINGQSIPQKVETGIRTESEVQILSGLKQGDTVIVTGIMSLRPNLKVSLIEAEAQQEK